MREYVLMWVRKESIQLLIAPSLGVIIKLLFDKSTPNILLQHIIPEYIGINLCLYHLEYHSYSSPLLLS